MALKADTQSCSFLIESMALSVSYWTHCCENKSKLVLRSENGVEGNQVLWSCIQCLKLRWCLHIGKKQETAAFLMCFCACSCK